MKNERRLHVCEKVVQNVGFHNIFKLIEIDEVCPFLFPQTKK